MHGDGRKSQVNCSQKFQLNSATPRGAAAQEQRQQEKRGQQRMPGVEVGGRNSSSCRRSS